MVIIGVTMPTDSLSREDGFRAGTYSEPDAFGQPAELKSLAQMVDVQPVFSSGDKILSGEFKYARDTDPWWFSTPIDWGKPANERKTDRALQSLFIADPFLANFEINAVKSDFDQAVFFLLDWQKFHQRDQQLTADSWEPDIVAARVARLAYVLSRIENDRSLAGASSTKNLISLADFHIKRARDPEYGLKSVDILAIPAFEDLCAVLDGLPSCAREEIP